MKKKENHPHAPTTVSISLCSAVFVRPPYDIIYVCPKIPDISNAVKTYWEATGHQNQNGIRKKSATAPKKIHLKSNYATGRVSFHNRLFFSSASHAVVVHLHMALGQSHLLSWKVTDERTTERGRKITATNGNKLQQQKKIKSLLLCTFSHQTGHTSLLLGHTWSSFYSAGRGSFSSVLLSLLRCVPWTKWANGVPPFHASTVTAWCCAFFLLDDGRCAVGSVACSMCGCKSKYRNWMWSSSSCACATDNTHNVQSP